jgi:hypothetical protein
VHTTVDLDTDAGTLLDGTFDPLSVPSTTCTPWELVATDVEAFSLSYFRARTNGNAIFELDEQARSRPRRTSPSSFGRADITQIRDSLTLARTVAGAVVRHDVVGTVRLRNR